MAGRGVDIKLGGAEASQAEYEEIKKLGGLFVLGTERHEARRIDNQLRGRSGRQGDPGESQFFVSLEDSLMRVFASDTIKKMMGRLGIPEDEPIENRIITRQLEAAQTKIEGFNFDARKRVLEYDDVLNRQRHSIYGERLKILTGSDADVEALLYEIAGAGSELEGVVNEKKEALGQEAFYKVLRRLMLQTFDYFWMQHLEVMDYIRGSVNLRAYGQRDPLVEYKKEGIRLYREMREAIGGHIAELLPRVVQGAFTRGEQEARVERARIQLGMAGDGSSGLPAAQLNGLAGSDPANASRATTVNQSVVIENSGPKVGRNDPCPCGSGKKYKKCHGK
jgi:preprotein translocase subunit SecA